MSLKPWEQLHEESLVRYKVFDVRKSLRRSPRNGAEIGFFIINTWDWVNVVAFTKDQQLIMVRQYRQGTKEVTLEIPGGILHAKDEDPEIAAIRELREETGYQPGMVQALGGVSSNPAIFNNRCMTFLATDCEPVGDLIQDQGEDLEVVLLPLDEVEDKVRRGEIAHSLVVVGLYLYRLSLKD